jgi:putative hemolysin
MISVRSNCPVSAALMRKYVDSSIGQRTPFGTYTKEPSLKTAELRAAKKLSLYGTTEPRYFSTKSGCSRTASPNEQKMMPSLPNSALYVVPTETESNTASTATPASIFCSRSGIPSLSYVSRILGSSSSRLPNGLAVLGAE